MNSAKINIAGLKQGLVGISTLTLIGLAGERLTITFKDLTDAGQERLKQIAIMEHNTYFDMENPYIKRMVHELLDLELDVEVDYVGDSGQPQAIPSAEIGIGDVLAQGQQNFIVVQKVEKEDTLEQVDVDVRIAPISPKYEVIDTMQISDYEYRGFVIMMSSSKFISLSDIKVEGLEKITTWDRQVVRDVWRHQKQEA